MNAYRRRIVEGWRKKRERERAEGYGMLVGSTVGKVGHLRPRIEEEFEL